MKSSSVFSSFGIIFSILPIIFIAMFVLVFTFIIVVLVRALRHGSQNSKLPVLTVSAAVVAKRGDVNSYGGHVGRVDATDFHAVGSRTYTDYYATFQVQSGDRMELRLQDGQYGLIAEGDRGMLTFQGDSFISFERQ